MDTDKKTKRNPRCNLPPGPGPGRPKGLKNKLSNDIKQRILDVWAKLEKNKKGLSVVAKDDPAWFYENFVKALIPKDVKLEGDVGLIVQVVRYTDVNDDKNPK